MQGKLVAGLLVLGQLALGGLAGVPTDSRAESAKQAAAAKDIADKGMRAKYQVLLASQRFDELDAAGNAILAQYHAKAISADTLTEQLLLMNAVSGKGLLADMEAWARAKPKSYAAHFVLGVQYLDVARQARGGKFAGETSAAQFGEMESYLAKAQDALEKSIGLESKPYPSHRSLVTIAGLRGDYRGTRSALQNAVRTDPDAVGAYIRYIEYNSPRWGGTYEQLDKVVADARRTPISRKNLGIIEAEVLRWHALDQTGLNQNPGGAVDYWLAAYKAKPGQRQVGYLYSAALDAKAAKQIDRAIGIYTRIVGEFKDESDAFFKRGALYHEEKQDYARAFNDFLEAATLGDKFAQSNVGFYYMTGKAGTTDLALAKKYLQLSADQGYDHAKEKLKLLESMLARK